MDDKRTPVEAEVQELPPRREPCCPEDSYGTAAKPRLRRSHGWLWVFLGLAVIAACSFSVVVSALHGRAERENGGLRLSFREQEQTEPPQSPIRNLEVPETDSYTPAAQGGTDSLKLRLDETGGEALSASEVYAKAAPAVVGVEAESYYGSVLCTGVVLSADGYILTASDGLSGAASITVSLSDGSRYSASRVGEERVTGLCLLKIEASGLPTAVFAEEDSLAVGEGIYCVCEPYGSQLGSLFYSGMLSARQTVEVSGLSCGILKASVSAPELGYGCPILDRQGRVLGLTTPIGKRLVSGEDPCFAVCAESILECLSAFERSASADGRWLGLEVEDIPSDYLHLFNFPGRVWIEELCPGTAPYGVLYQYDVITAVDGVEVSTAAEYRALIDAHAPGDRVRLTLYRNGQGYTILLPVYSR